MTAVIDELKAAVAQTVKPSSGPLAWGLDKAAEGYARLPLGVFSAMQDSFKKNPNLYAAYMLSCIAEKCGVWEDPLWMQYSGINRPASIPWSTSRLRYMVEASGQ
jgi:hypothetical protein